MNILSDSALRRVFIVYALAAAHAVALLVTVHNDVPRLDQFGHIVNAHDGSVVRFNGTYFMCA